MKRIIDFSQQIKKSNTTGWSKSLLANYVCILSIAGNSSWKKKIRKKDISLETYTNVVNDIMKWIFADVAEDDIEKSKNMSKSYWTAAASAKDDDYKWNDTVLPVDQERQFRATPVLRSLVVHLGIADFEEAELDRNDNTEIIYPFSLEVNWNKSWSNLRNANFENLVAILSNKVRYSSLTVLVDSETVDLCKRTDIDSSGPKDKIKSSSKISTNEDKSPNWGAGKYLLFYGPPGTGKTREANRYIQTKLAKQIETSSEGEIQPSMLMGTWSSEFRNTVLREIRKFVSVCQFHSTYSYEDFIEGLRPIPGENGQIRYEVVDGSFLAAWRKAAGKSANLSCKLIKNSEEFVIEIDPYYMKLYDFDVELSVEVFIPLLNDYFQASYIPGTNNQLKINLDQKSSESLPSEKLFPVSMKGASWSTANEYFVLVDEINRGKVSKIFGELLFAMSASDEDKYPEVRTQYSKTPLILVKNLSLIGTLNSCDKSVDVLDQALKRRFELHELMPLSKSDFAHEPIWKNMIETFESTSGIDLSELLDGINSKILEQQIDYDRQVGHSYLFKISTDARNATQSSDSADLKRDIYFRSVFKTYFSDIFPVLQDFFIDQREILERFVPKSFLTPNSYALNADVRRLLTNKDIRKFDEQAWSKIKIEFQKTIESLQGKAFSKLRTA